MQERSLRWPFLLAAENYGRLSGYSETTLSGTILNIRGHY
jgi:hypothetical protein